MKAEFESILNVESTTFHARRFEGSAFEHPFHYHPEFEIAYIGRSGGTVIVGDYIGSFQAEELYLIGSSLPHIFRHSTPPSGGASSEVLQFPGQTPDGCPMFAGGEWRTWRSLLEMSQRGLCYRGDVALEAAKLMQELREATGLGRWAIFVKIAQVLIDSAGDAQLLISPNYNNAPIVAGSSRMDQVCQYLVEHFKEDLSHQEIAQKFNFSAAAFSRLFKKATRKTYQTFLKELRLGHACRMLADTDATITQIAFESGFQNLSNFNRRFKDTYGYTPKEWRSMATRCSGHSCVNLPLK